MPEELKELLDQYLDTSEKLKKSLQKINESLQKKIKEMPEYKKLMDLMASESIAKKALDQAEKKIPEYEIRKEARRSLEQAEKEMPEYKKIIEARMSHISIEHDFEEAMRDLPEWENLRKAEDDYFQARKQMPEYKKVKKLNNSEAKARDHLFQVRKKMPEYLINCDQFYASCNQVMWEVSSIRGWFHYSEP